MACRAFDDYGEYIAKQIPPLKVYAIDNTKFPTNINDLTMPLLHNLFEVFECNNITQQAIIQQYNEIILYNIANIQERNILAPQCNIKYDAIFNLPTIIYPKFRPLIDEKTVWNTSTEDLPILLGIQLRDLGIRLSTYKDFIKKAVDLCEEYDLREDDILLNPSNVGFHRVLGLRIIDYGLTNTNLLLDF